MGARGDTTLNYYMHGKDGKMALLPVPVIVNGTPQMREHQTWWPGDPLPPIIHDSYSAYEYNKAQDAYVPYVPRPSVGGAVATAVYGFFVLGFGAMLLIYLWWLIIPVAVVAGIVKLFKS